MQMMSVTSLNTKIKSLLEATFMHVTVEGEVSAVTYHTSGHLYFTIKDDKSALRCVMWRSNVAKTKFRIEKGMHVVIHGSLRHRKSPNHRDVKAETKRRGGKISRRKRKDRPDNRDTPTTL